jgi:hypothetical protein
VIGLVLSAGVTLLMGITMGMLLVIVRLEREGSAAATAQGDRPKRVRVAGPGLPLSDYRGVGGVPWRL